MSRAVTLVVLLAAAAALALRCPQLDERPMHNDEAVNAIKFRALWEQGLYRYDPNEHHGPTIFYATLLWEKLTWAPDFAHFDESRFRIVAVLFGVGLILLLPLVTDGLGRGGTAAAAVLTAISPAMVFYSRYYIHEMLLVFFTFVALAAGWRYTRAGKAGWALLAGLGLGLMHATKETFVLTIAAAAGALVLNVLWHRRLEPAREPSAPGANPQPHAPRLKAAHLAGGLAVWLAVAYVLFTSFFTNPAGAVDSLRTYQPWIHRATGESPHLHPWNYYLERLAWFHPRRGPVFSEALILVLAVSGAVAAFRRKGLLDANAAFVRFLAFYTFILTALYSGIAYKTPWCLLSFWHGMILLAGAGVVALVSLLRRSRFGGVIALVVLAATAQLGSQAWELSINYASDRRNPYIYSPTSVNLLELVDEVEALAKAHPQGHQMVVKVMSPEDDYWPLPWYFRAFTQVGWWGRLPPNPYAPVMIVSPKLHADLDRKQTHVMAGLFELRPQVFLELYVQKDLWAAYLRNRSRPAPR